MRLPTRPRWSGPPAAAATYSPPKRAAAASTVGGFSFGQLQDQTVGVSGCGTNVDGEPSAHVSKDNLVAVGSEEGGGGGSELCRATQAGGPSSADTCQPVNSGQPNAVAKRVGASAGDIDTAFTPVRSSFGTYRLHVAIPNPINVAVSNDDGKTFSQVPVHGGMPIDDHEWIAAHGAHTSHLTYHDITSNNIDVLRSDNGSRLYTQIATAIPATDYKANNNQLSNIAFDHVTFSPTADGFGAYQSFVAPSTLTGSVYDEAGWTHIAYSHDSPDLSGSSTYTGYAVQQSGTPASAPN